jgi:hypothetical protein
MMADLKSKTAIYAKAIMFVLIGVTSSALLIAQNFTLQTIILVALVIWSFCRAYYFAFYVIEHYIDRNFRFAGLIAFGKYLMKRRS